MGKTYLQMKYHPAKKEVEFKRFENGRELRIKGGRLQRYMNQKGDFVLQHQGNEFFEDISIAFDGVKHLEMKVITTKMDYDDLEQRIEYYNTDPKTKCKITSTLIEELPDMKEMYQKIADYGERAISILEKHRYKMYDIKGISDEKVKDSVDNFSKQIGDEIENIRKKINSMRDNKVSLCFTGVYSAGKSALINAILGYKILPEGITSKTAKMFQISSPKPGEPVQMLFDIDEEKTVLEWDEKKQSMEFAQGPSENDERTKLQEKINEMKDKGKSRHEQILELLTKLNSMKAVRHDIQIKFPIPLDNERVQFTIYDTPGTDSNHDEHQGVLLDALSKQMQSILIFVAAPIKVEGTGNKTLFGYIKKAESENSKTSIDLDRSLFVINRSDSMDSDERKELQNGEIKYNKDEQDKSMGDSPIKLSDKKLFFTSAKMAYLARAKKNGIASEKEESIFEDDLGRMQNKYTGYVYRQNRCASSELATSKNLSQCEEKLKEAKNNNNDVAVMEICSGIYALEREIIQYGEKYASAVKAYAIIDSVNKALSLLSNKANSLKELNQDCISKIEDNIKQLEDTIGNAIDSEYDNKIIPKNDAIPENIVKELGLDRDTIQEKIVDNVLGYINSEFKGWLLGFGKVKFNLENSEKVREKCNETIDSFTTEFLKNKKRILEEEKEDYLNKVKQKIMDNGNIDDAAKQYFLNISESKLPEMEKVKNLEDEYQANKYTEGIWIFKTEYLNKDGFMTDVKKKLLNITVEMERKLRTDYRESLNPILSQIRGNFRNHLNDYSVDIKALIANKDAMEKLGEKVLKADVELKQCEEKFNKIIWSGVKLNE